MDLALLQQQQQHQQQQQLHHKHFNQSQFLNQLQSNTNNNSFSGNETHNGHYKQMSQPAMISQPNQLTQTQLPQQQQHQSFHRPSRSVLHVRENSIDELDALFDPSKWANRKTNNVPLAKRNLPQSFFKPPETGGTKTPKLINSNNHSRQNSIDQANMINHSQLLNQQHLILQQKLNTLNSSTQQANHLSSNFHTRSVSEPVAAALSPFNLNQPQTQFTQQNSLLFKNQSNQQSIQNQSLPYGWRAAKTQTGQRFYVNYITKQTSWTVPHQTQDATNSSYFDQQNNQLENFISSSSSASSSPVLNLNNLNNPAEADLNMNTGHINSHLNIEIKNDCIINANPNSLGLSTASTVSSSASVSASDDDLISDFQQNQQFELQTQLEKLENQQQLEFLLNQIPMPNGWEKAQTAKGEVYFINHNNKSTYWEDPRISLIPNFLKQQKLKNAQSLMRLNPHASDQQAANNQQLINSSQQVNNSSISPMFINNTVSNNLSYNGSNLTSNTSTSITNGIITASSNLINGETVNDSNFDMLHQTNHGDIKSLIVEVINKKKELFKSLEDLNKQETFLRAQLNAAYSNSGLPVGSNPSNEFNMNFEENFEIGINLELGANVSVGKNITNSVENIQGINTNIGQESSYSSNIELEKINTIQSNKSSSSSSSPSSILSSSSTNSNNMTYYLKNDNLDSSNNMNTFPANSNTLHMTSDQKNAKKMQNGENLLSIIKTESTNPQLVDLDTVSCLYNKLLINNNQNSQFQMDQQNIPHSLINSLPSLPNKIPDFI